MARHATGGGAAERASTAQSQIGRGGGPDGAVGSDSVPNSQKSEPFVEPSREQIPARTREHVAAMEATDADLVWCAAGMHHLILHTVGRRSGEEHKAALPYWVDPGGHRIVVASYAGAPRHPAWYLNLADRDANPLVRVRVQRGEFWAEAETLEGDERRRIWEALVADRPFYADYQSRTTRRLPLVRLVERRPA
jgi:deazaflavin-dependent oxidoreductase (nitroreductase family)